MPSAESAALGLTAAEELLLRAAVTEGQAVQGLLADWRRARGFERYDEIDFGSMLLLPRVYRNLAAAGVDDPWWPQLAALARYHWLKNATRIGKLLPVLARLQQTGARPLLAGSLALLAGGYLDDASECPELAPQIMVSPTDGERVREVLQESGWKCPSLPPVPGWRSELWRGPDEVSLRVEYQWLPRRYPVIGATALLPRAQAAELSGTKVLVPSATDLLLHCSVRAAYDRAGSGQRAVHLADAIRILQRHSEQIDWQRLLGPSQSAMIREAIQPTLEYLAEHFAVPIPADCLAGACSAASQRPAKNLWARYAQAEQAAGRSPSSLGAIRYVAWRIGAKAGIKKLLVS